jgi:hypothetical protein
MDGHSMEMKYRSFEANLQYGKAAEEIIYDALLKMGAYAIPKYLYVKEGAPSLFGLNNRYAVPDLDTASQGKRIWIEVKRKAQRDKYPDTGFPPKNLEEYKKVQEITGDKVFIIFIDEKACKVYGNWLNKLLEPTVIIHNNKSYYYPKEETDRWGRHEIYFPIKNMIHIDCFVDNKISEFGLNILRNVLFDL